MQAKIAFHEIALIGERREPLADPNLTYLLLAIVIALAACAAVESYAKKVSSLIDPAELATLAEAKAA